MLPKCFRHSALRLAGPACSCLKVMICELRCNQVSKKLYSGRPGSMEIICQGREVVKMAPKIAPIRGISIFIHFLSCALKNFRYLSMPGSIFALKQADVLFLCRKLTTKDFAALKNLLTLSSLLHLIRGVR